MKSTKTVATILILAVILALVVSIGAIVFAFYRLNHSVSIPAGMPSSVTSMPLPPDLADATYTFYGDTFTMSNGQATLQQGHAFAPASGSATPPMPLVPISYMLAGIGAGSISASSTPDNPGSLGTVAAVYREFGANLEWTVLFVFTQNPDGSPRQIASGVGYEQDAKIQSVSLANGIVTLNLLVVSKADQQKPHYEQVPTQPETLQFTISGNQLAPL